MSAAQADYRVTAVDAFGDLDLCAVADVIRAAPTGQHFDPYAAAEIGGALDADLVAYTSNLENHPRAVARLEVNARLAGNAPEVLRRVRNPIRLMDALRRAGLDVPLTRASAPVSRTPGTDWLLKPRRSGGGHGITAWHSGLAVPRSHYLQEWIEGIPGSIVFAADGHDAVMLGLSRQLVGDARFGAQRFRYCGNLLAGRAGRLFPHQQRLESTATRLAEVVSREFGLVGLNGVDFIARNGVPYPIEVNPRCSASVELLQRAQGLSIFEVHVAACRGSLPSAPSKPTLVWGKAVVFARTDLIMRDTRSWPGRAYADIPHPKERIPAGRPICTVFADAPTVGSCMRSLVKRAAGVYRAAKPLPERVTS
jgi:predicted ATP-grasp superfamily ATP-dependent carboligase